MNPLSTQSTHHSNMHMITLGTCLDAQAEHLLESAVYQAQEAQGRHILLDLQALTTIDSRGADRFLFRFVWIAVSLLTYERINHLRCSRE